MENPLEIQKYSDVDADAGDTADQQMSRWADEQMLILMIMLMFMLMLAVTKELHTSERTILSWTVIFSLQC